MILFSSKFDIKTQRSREQNVVNRITVLNGFLLEICSWFAIRPTGWGLGHQTWSISSVQSTCPQVVESVNRLLESPVTCHVPFHDTEQWYWRYYYQSVSARDIFWAPNVAVDSELPLECCMQDAEEWRLTRPIKLTRRAEAALLIYSTVPILLLLIQYLACVLITCFLRNNLIAWCLVWELQ